MGTLHLAASIGDANRVSALSRAGKRFRLQFERDSAFAKKNAPEWRSPPFHRRHARLLRDGAQLCPWILSHHHCGSATALLNTMRSAQDHLSCKTDPVNIARQKIPLIRDLGSVIDRLGVPLD
jgi:hypothetical protein